MPKANLARKNYIHFFGIAIILLIASYGFCLNQPPICDPGGPYAIEVGEELNIQAYAGDPDSGTGDFIVKCEWDINGDGDYDITGTTISPTITWETLSSLLTQGVHYPTSPMTEQPYVSMAMRVTDTFGAKDTRYAILKVYDPSPVAIMNITPNPGTAAQPVSFSGNQSYSGSLQRSLINYAWKFSHNGTVIATVAGKSPNYTFQDAGIYDVNLTVTDSLGCTDSIAQTLVINNPPNNLPVALADGPYTIDIGNILLLDGSASYDPDSEFGDYIVQYEWDINGDCVYDVTGSETPRVSWQTLSSLIAQGVQYPASPITGNPYISISLRVTDTYGASNIGYTTLRVYATNPTALMDLSPIPGTAGQPVSFSGIASYAGNPDRSIVGWTWKIYQDSSLIATITGQSANYTFESSGVYDVHLTVIDQLGYNDTIEQTIVINDSIDHHPIAHPGGPYILFIGNNLTLNASGSFDPDGQGQIIKYEWDLNNDGVYDFTNPYYSQIMVNWQQLSSLITPQSYPADPVTNEPNLTIRLRVTDSTGLTGTAQTKLRIYSDLPTPVAIMSPQPSIAGGHTYFDGTGSYGCPLLGSQIVSWTWKIYKDSVLIDTLAGSNVSYLFPEVGEYQVELTVTDDASRSNAKTHSLLVTHGSYTILGDLNNDSKVDFGDFAIMAENWMIDCVQAPTNPACTPKY